MNKVGETTDHVVNGLTVKYHIFQQKCLGEKPRFEKIRKEITFMFNMEYDIACTNKKKLSSIKKWKPVLHNQLFYLC